MKYLGAALGVIIFGDVRKNHWRVYREAVVHDFNRASDMLKHLGLGAGMKRGDAQARALADVCRVVPSLRTIAEAVLKGEL